MKVELILTSRQPSQSLKAGDTVIEDFDDYLVFWTYDGTAWVKNFTHNKADANSTFETYNTTIPVTYTTPNTIPTDPEAGDTLIEQFTDGLVYWTYDGTNWVKNFTDSKDIHSYHILQTGNAPSLTPAFPVPITTAQAGDTAIVKWDDGEAKYTFDGTTWILDWFEPEVSGGVDCADVINNGANSANVIQLPNVQDAAGNVTVLNVNGNIPLAATGNAGYVSGGKLVIPGVRLEHASNITGIPNIVVPGLSPFILTNVAGIISITNTTPNTRIYSVTIGASIFVLDGTNRIPKVQTRGVVTGTGTVINNITGLATNGGNSNDTQFDHTLYTFIYIRLTPGQTFNIQQTVDVANGGTLSFTLNIPRIQRTILSWAEEN